MTKTVRVSRPTRAGPVHLDVTVTGSGPAVVLVPSLGRGAVDFASLAARLTDVGWLAAAVDPRGIGNSSGPLSGIDLHDLAADVAAVVRAVSTIGRATVVGHAFGNRVARCLAADAPACVDRLVLLAAGGHTPPEPAAVDSFRAFLAGGLTPAQAAAAIAYANFSPTSDPDAWTRDWWLETAAAQIAAAKATDTSDWWQACSAPMLVIQGLHDRMAPPENGRSLAAAGKATLIEIADAGHALLPEQPDTIADCIIDYLRRPVS